MTSLVARRVAGASALGFVVLAFAGLVLSESETPNFGLSPVDEVRAFTEGTPSLGVAVALFAFAALAVLAFVSGLRSVVPDGVGARVASAAGTLLAANLALLAATSLARTDGEWSTATDDGVRAVVAVVAVWNALFYTQILWTAALILAASVASHGTGALPRWLVLGGFVVGGVGFVNLFEGAAPDAAVWGTLHPLAQLLPLVWFVTTGVALLVARPRAGRAGA